MEALPKEMRTCENCPLCVRTRRDPMNTACADWEEDHESHAARCDKVIEELRSQLANEKEGRRRDNANLISHCDGLREVMRDAQHDLDASEGLYCTDQLPTNHFSSLPKHHFFKLEHGSLLRVRAVLSEVNEKKGN